MFSNSMKRLTMKRTAIKISCRRLDLFAAALLATSLARMRRSANPQRLQTEARLVPPKTHRHGATNCQEHRDDFETMGKMKGMKPRDGMSPQEQKEWMAEHEADGPDDGPDDGGHP
jgi:hypothetical protein